MSIVTLLADFPNYSARKVRRLAKQITLIQAMVAHVKIGEGSGLLKSIEADLIEFNLLQAKTEEQLNDDIMHPTTEAIAEQVMKPVVKPFIWWGKETPLPDTLEEAHEWITSMLDDWKELAGNMGFEQFQDPEVLIERAKKAAPASPDHVTEFGGIAADAGNPAWWRGHDEACTILCQKVNAILDGNDDGRGVANDPWESTRRRLLAAALRSQGQADAVGETEWIVSCGSGASPAPRFDNEPAAFARWAEEVSIPSYIRSGRMRHASVTKVTTISEDRTTAALAQQAKLSLQESLPLDTPE